MIRKLFRAGLPMFGYWDSTARSCSSSGSCVAGNHGLFAHKASFLNACHGDGSNKPGSPPNGTNTDRNQSTKVVPCTSETIVSKIPLPKMVNNRSRSGSTSPSKQNTGPRESSPTISQSPTRGRRETKTPVGQQIHVISSKGSPTSPGLPTLGWSLQKEKQELRPKENTPRELSEPTLYQDNIKRNPSFLMSGSPQKIPYGNENETLDTFDVSPSRLYGNSDAGNEAAGHPEFDSQYTNNEGDENEETSESKIARKRSYEAFVMTGDRMINLAKTPANNDFRSKYYKPSLEPIPLLEDESASLPSSPPPLARTGAEIQDKKFTNANAPTTVQQSREGGCFELKDQSGNESNVVVRLRSQPQRNRSSVRTSKSEDQLMLMDNLQTSPDVDDCSGSIHTLLWETAVTPTADQPTERTTDAKLSTSVGRSPPSRQYSVESNESSPEKVSTRKQRSSAAYLHASHHHPPLNTTYTISPDISTSSLVSASEHYNGGSLLMDNICSPQTSSSSPDTPEWSLIDSFHQQTKTVDKFTQNSHDSPSKRPLLANQEKDEDDEYDEPYHDQDQKDIESEDSINNRGNKVIITIGNKSGSPVAATGDSKMDGADPNLNLKIKSMQNPNEFQRQPSWTPLSSSADILPSMNSETSPRRQSPKRSNLHQNGIQEEEVEDVNYAYATPYSPDQEHKNGSNHPYVPPPIFASPTSAPINNKGTHLNRQIGIDDSPSSITSSEDSESDLESIQSYHPPAKVIDIPSAKRLATRLYHLDGFKKTDVSRHLSRNNEYNQVVADEYLKYFDFSRKTLDSSLRLFLSQFCLTGETQERERVLLHFSKRYLESNPEVLITEENIAGWFRSQDSVHTLTCAIMLLNTDLHGENLLQRRMTCNEFIENLSELNDGGDFPWDLLRNIYYAIKQEPIPWAAASDEDLGTLIPAELVQQSSGAGDVVAQANNSTSLLINTTNSHQQYHRIQSSPEPENSTAVTANNNANNIPSNSTMDIKLGKTGGGVNPFLSLPDPNTSTDYKKGYVMRKCCIGPNGKKTKLGKRSWKMFFLSLRDMVLYCFKEEKSLRTNGAFCDVNNAIRVHHGLAERASDYTKKQFVFRLHTADQAQYLFQTSDEKELLTWIDAINFVVASLSAPQLPAPCSSDYGRFQRPLMPSSKSTLNLSEQLVSHERQLMLLRRQIEDHLQSPPTKNSKGAQIHNYNDKQDFLTFEIKRYETYILTLRTKSVLEDDTSATRTEKYGPVAAQFN